MKDVDRKKLIQDYYSKRSKDYDRQKSRTWKSERGFGNEVLEELLTALADFRNRLVLEVGVGSGRNALPLIEKVQPQFIGVDLSKDMLRHAKTKMSSFKNRFDLILADGENLPFINNVFDALMCMSTMHYFSFQDEALHDFKDVLKRHGTFLYGDLTAHEGDNQEFFEGLERTLSKAHARYYKQSEVEKLLTKQGFHISTMKKVAFRKTYTALMEDKGQYFKVDTETLQNYMKGAAGKAKEQYALTDAEMTLFYTIITAREGKHTR